MKHFHRWPSALILLAFAVCGSGLVQAQTFTVTPASGPGPFAIAWDVPNGTACQAAGIVDWNGAVAASGTKSVKPGTGTKTLTLACTVPGPAEKGSVTLTWQPPTQNVDGSALTNLSGFRLYYGTAANALNTTAAINNAGVSRYTIENLNAGTWHFAITALNSSGAESDKSGTVSKTVTDTSTTQPWTASATIEVTAPAKPKAPVLSIVSAPP